jgi:hypothetical protein
MIENSADLKEQMMVAEVRLRKHLKKWKFSLLTDCQRQCGVGLRHGDFCQIVSQLFGENFLTMEHTERKAVALRLVEPNTQG